MCRTMNMNIYFVAYARKHAILGASVVLKMCCKKGEGRKLLEGKKPKAQLQFS